MSKTIAVIRTGGIGDVILSTISINIIKTNLPTTKIIWFGREPTISLIKSFYPDVEVHEIASNNTYTENISVFKQSANNIDAIIDLQHSARSIILGRLMAIRFRCTYTTWNKYSIERSLLVIQSKLRGRKFNIDWFKRNLPNRYEAMAECTMHSLKKMGVSELVNKKYIPGFNLASAAKNQKAIAICLGAKFLAKALPPDKVGEVIEGIITTNQIGLIYFLGDKNQATIADNLKSEFGTRIEIKNLCGNTSLVEAATILNECKFSITNDSALSHLSEIVNTPVLAFFGPTHPKFGYRPYLEHSDILSIELGCRPCDKNGNTTCSYNDYACSSLLKKSKLVEHITKMCNA